LVAVDVEPESFPDMGAGVVDGIVNLAAVFRGGRGGFKVPMEVGLEQGVDSKLFDFKAMFADEFFPCGWGEKASVARVAPFFHLVEPLFCFGIVVRGAAVDDKQVSAGL